MDESEPGVAADLVAMLFENEAQTDDLATSESLDRMLLKEFKKSRSDSQGAEKEDLLSQIPEHERD